MEEQQRPRSPLDPTALAVVAGPAWSVTLMPTAASTNHLAAERPRPDRVVIADHQTAGRGRLDRSWQTPAGTGLTFSAVVDPGLADAHWPLVPLAAGLAVADACRRAGARPSLKWPNDVLLGETGGKVAGILVERVADPALAVIGIGINVDLHADELPVPTATSLAIHGVDVHRTTLFGWVLAALRERLEEVRRDRTEMLTAYRSACGTIGRDVEVLLPAGQRLQGRAVDVDEGGRLVVESGGKRHGIAAGDVVHVRPRA